eukprot:1181754-Prorocentrum_minimum.AAC.7
MVLKRGEISEQVPFCDPVAQVGNKPSNDYEDESFPNCQHNERSHTVTALLSSLLSLCDCAHYAGSWGTTRRRSRSRCSTPAGYPSCACSVCVCVCRVLREAGSFSCPARGLVPYRPPLPGIPSVSRARGDDRVGRRVVMQEEKEEEEEGRRGGRTRASRACTRETKEMQAEMRAAALGLRERKRSRRGVKDPETEEEEEED